MKIAALTLVSLALAATGAAAQECPMHAQHATSTSTAVVSSATQSPYAGEEARAIKALSEADVKALLEGTGMGFAKPAELNQYPGPRHVLDNAEALELSAAQRAAIDASYQRMKAEAVPLGRQLVDVERHLDSLFAEGRADAPSVARLTSEAADLQGRLRAVHLRAHVELRDLLSATQIQKYVALRGYGHGAHEGHQGQ